MTRRFPGTSQSLGGLAASTSVRLSLIRVLGRGQHARLVAAGVQT